MALFERNWRTLSSLVFYSPPLYQSLDQSEGPPLCSIHCPSLSFILIPLSARFIPVPALRNCAEADHLSFTRCLFPPILVRPVSSCLNRRPVPPLDTLLALAEASRPAAFPVPPSNEGSYCGSSTPPPIPVEIFCQVQGRIFLLPFPRALK